MQKLNFVHEPLFLCGLLGTASFLALFGHRILDPGNIAWLCHGDPVQHFLGWHYFRAQDWSFPIGLNPNFGLELSNAIVYTDSTPLLAIPLKLFSSFFPAVFQYTGFWLLACFILQAWFGWKLTALATPCKTLCLLGAGLFVLSPPMIVRLGGHSGISGHFSLVGHFVLLAALFLVLRPDNTNRGRSWCLLLLTTALIHAYLFAMVALLWLAGLADEIRAKTLSPVAALRELILTTGVVGVVCWQAGYFAVGAGTSSAGFGFFRMNLLSLFDSNGWSWILPDIPEKKGCYEGFNYFGLGALMLGVSALPSAVRHRAAVAVGICRRPFFATAMLCLFVFALSHNVAIGQGQLSYALPDQLLRLANVFRSSGRMFWPVYYLLLWGVIRFAVQDRGYRLSAILLACALLIQVVDTGPGWLPIRAKLMTEPRAQCESPLQDPFWSEAAARYAKVRQIYPTNQPPDWAVLAMYAREHGLGTDVVYFARMDQKALLRSRTRGAEMLQTGCFDRDSLYILDNEAFALAQRSVDPDRDLLTTIDGFHVLAPGWKNVGVGPRSE